MSVAREGKDMVLYGLSYPVSPLDSEEMAVFEAQFDKLFGMNDSVERELFQDRRDVILGAIKAIKYKLNGPRFNGWNAGDQELGWSAIRPGHIRRNNVIGTVWLETFAAAGTWQRWYDSAAGVGYVAPYAAGQVILGIESLPFLTSVQPLVSATRWEIDRQVLVPFDVRGITIGDNARQVPIYPHPTILILPRSTVLSRIVSDITGNDYIRPVGLTIGLGKFIKVEAPAAGDWTAF